jgi:hypothetical protein
MNRHERRRFERFCQFDEETGGVFVLLISSLVSLIRRPEPFKTAFARGAAEVAARVSRGAIECLLCRALLLGTTLAAVGVAVPSAPHPRHTLTFGLCADCTAQPEAELKEAVYAVLRGIWPEMRELDPAALHPGGRA